MTRKCQVRFGGRGSEKDSTGCTSPGSYPTLLDTVQMYASVEPVDELGKKKRVIILLPGEY